MLQSCDNVELNNGHEVKRWIFQSWAVNNWLDGLYCTVHIEAQIVSGES